jgi:hypothetical protein
MEVGNLYDPDCGIRRSYSDLNPRVARKAAKL